LQAFVDQVRAVATAVSVARRRTPPPTVMKSAIPAWQTFVEARGGTLFVARMMMVDVPWDGAALGFETTFDDDGEPNGVRATMRTAATLSGDPPDDLRTKLTSSIAIEVQANAIVATWSGACDDPARCVADLDVVRAMIDRLSVDARTGPYR
jgi:hypothetical protein